MSYQKNNIAMKRYILLLIAACWSPLTSGQNTFPTNGPVGECLFPQQANGEAACCETIECDLTREDIAEHCRQIVYDMEQHYGIGVHDRFENSNKIEFVVEIPVGEEYKTMDTSRGFCDMLRGTFSRDERVQSKIIFRTMIEYKDGKYKYTLFDFYTKRRMIHGEGKNDGPSNLIHWQRVNSLTKERQAFIDSHNMKRAANREKLEAEYDSVIRSEQEQYLAEYNAVQMFVSTLRLLPAMQDADF